MIVSTTVPKKEIEDAINDFIFDQLETGYGHEFGESKLVFINKDGALGDFACVVETEVIKKGTK